MSRRAWMLLAIGMLWGSGCPDNKTKPVCPPDQCGESGPANLLATPGAAHVLLSWDPVSGATGYNVYWSTSPGVTPATGSPVAVDAPPFRHTPLWPGTAVYYVVTAVLPAGESPPSTEASATPTPVYGEMAALYPAHGAGWNDYVRNDGPGALEASDTACDASVDTGGYSSCLHGGELRAFDAALPTGCDGITAEDDAAPGGAFHWTCRSSAAGFEVVSTGLQEGQALSDLLAPDAASGLWAWKDLVLRVYRDAVPVASTYPTVWWPNPVVDLTSQSELTTPGAVYVAGARRNTDVQQLHVTAPRVALLAEAGSDILSVSAASQPFLWLEGNVGSMTGFGPAVSWSGVDHSVIRDLRALSCPDCPVLLLDGRDDSVSDVTIALGTGSALRTSTTTYARIHATGGYSYGTTDAPWAGVGVGGENNILVQVAMSGGAWLALGDSTSLGGHALVGFTGANAAPTFPGNPPAPLLRLGGGSTAAQLVLTNADVGLVVNGTGNWIYDVAACDNGIHGVEDWGAGTWWDGVLIVGHNGSSDCWQPGSPVGTPTCPVGPTLYTGCTLGGHFVGKVASADPVNQSASNPAGAISGVTDWTGFVDRWRGWGVDSADAFPAASNRGRCAYGHDCRMWDLSLMAGPAWLRGNATGRLVAHPWHRDTAPTSQADCDALVRGSIFVATSPPLPNVCHSVVVLGAVEIAGDGIGNDNGLCENGEACLIAPNLGAYQGHGVRRFLRTYQPVPDFRVDLYADEWNGYVSGDLP